MVSKNEALRILRREADYEEKITHDLANYFLKSIEGCRDLSEEEREKMDNHLKIIWGDSVEHTESFNEMITYVLNKESEDF